MRSGILYAAVCVTLASLAHGQHTVTEFRTITTTMYREHEAAPTATRGIDNGGLTDIAGPAPQPTDDPLVKEPPPPMNEPPKDGPPMNPPNEPPMPNEPPKDEPPKGPNEPPKGPNEPPKGPNELPKGPNEPPKSELPKDGPPPPNGKDIEPPKGGPLTDLNPPKNDGALKPTGTLPIGNKINPSAGASASKSSGAATDFTFSPITLAPESSQGELGASLRELTASHKPTGKSASTHDSSAVGTYSMSFAAIAGMTLMGAVALVQL